MPTATRFACQTGYFRYSALAEIEGDVRRILGSGGRIDLVVGANEQRLAATDLEDALDLIAAAISTQASFTLVAATDALFHPKTYYCEDADGTRHALVGSANLTVPGIGHNIESCLALRSDEDGNTVLNEIRDAIMEWPEKARRRSRNAKRITPLLIRKLAAERTIAPSRRAAEVGAGNVTPRSRFGRLARIVGAPARPRRRRRRTTPPVERLAASVVPFPTGTVGVFKILSSLDLKGFAGGAGTPYVALSPNPRYLAARLPMRSFGKRGEPRLDVFIEARLDSALRDVVNSGTDPSNITHVGMGRTRKSNPDLRLNVLHGVIAGLIHVGTQRRAPMPNPGDALAIEFLEGGRTLHLTFATRDPLRSALLNLPLTGRTWGWLPAGVVPPW